MTLDSYQNFDFKRNVEPTKFCIHTLSSAFSYFSQSVRKMASSPTSLKKTAKKHKDQIMQPGLAFEELEVIWKKKKDGRKKSLH